MKMPIHIVVSRSIRFVFILLVISFSSQLSAQDQVIELDTAMFEGYGYLQLAEQDGWLFKKGHDPDWALPDLNTQDWDTLSVTNINYEMADENGRLEGWLRVKIRLDSTFEGMAVRFQQRVWAATDIYLDGEHLNSFGNTGINGEPYEEYKRETKKTWPLPITVGEEHLIAIHFVDSKSPFSSNLKSGINVMPGFFNITEPEYDDDAVQFWDIKIIGGMMWAALMVMTLLFWLIYFQNRKVKHLLYISITISLYNVLFLIIMFSQIDGITFVQQRILDNMPPLFLWLIFAFIPLSVASVFKESIPRFLRIYTAIITIFALLDVFTPLAIGGWYIGTSIGIAALISGFYLLKFRRELKGPRWAIVIGFITTIVAILAMIIGIVMGINNQVFQGATIITAFIAIPLSLLIYISLWLRKMIRDTSNQALRLVEASNEKKRILSEQNVLLEKKVAERTKELQDSLDLLKETQDQLVHSEKMASLGELTAGIAHEIQNPLNFVNNFAEVNLELAEEMKEELDKGNHDEVILLATDIKENESKILHHGKRAEDIVKSMLQHSRGSEGKKEPTDINQLADEYLRLAYHGMRAKDKAFNATMETEFDKSIKSLDLVPQDIGRVILNMVTNAFHAVAEKKKDASEGYKPMVSVSTSKKGSNVEICISDNGPGIPDEIKEKIFQPFFTTKISGKGTGLGLSLSYDIVYKGHNGSIDINSTPGEGTEFKIILPIEQK